MTILNNDIQNNMKTKIIKEHIYIIIMFELFHDIKPSDDFYHHVNTSWINKSTIPDDNMIWNVFRELNDVNLEKLKQLLKEPKDNRIDCLYKQSLELTTATNKQYKAQEYIDRIYSCKDILELRKLVIDLFMLNGITCTNSFYVYNDFIDSKKNILHIGSGGLGLPDRDYYFKPDKVKIIEEYKKFILTYLSLFNLPFDINESVKSIYMIEEKLAQFTYTNVEKRDSERMNNPSNMDIISVVNPELSNDLLYFFNKIKVVPEKINITNPTFTKNYYELLKIVDLQKWKEYFIYSFLRKMGNYINIDSETVLFNFYSKVLSGTKVMKEPVKRSIETLNTIIGMLVGKLFVERYFNEKSKQKVTEMIEFIKLELTERLSNNDWMELETKKKAIDKLNKMNFKVGYPDKWRDYTELQILPDNLFFQNILNCYKFDFDYELKYLYKEIDRTQWFMNPHEINAYYSPSYNEIVFPCGILMEPFFSIEQDIACNFGGIGCIIGHEITHGFDDMGRKFDGDGNLNDWWTKKDAEKYVTKSDILKKLFNELKIEGQNVNGELTLGENIADLGGVEISFNSLKKYYTKHPDEVKSDSYQKFFYNYANVWRCIVRKEEAIKRLTTDPHSPPCYRVNTILSNVSEFYKYFSIDEKSKMWIEPTNRASIW